MQKNVVSNPRVFLLISAAIVVIALIMQLLGVGLNFGIDFTGGSVLSYTVGQEYDIKDVYKILGAAGYSERQVTKTSPVGDAVKTGLEIRLDLIDETEGFSGALDAAVKAALPTAELIDYRTLSSAEAAENGYDAGFVGGIIAEYQISDEFGATAARASILAELSSQYSVKNLEAVAYDSSSEAEDESDEGAADEDPEDVADDEDAADEADEDPAAQTALRVFISFDGQAARVRQQIEEKMSEKYADFAFVSIEHVSATAGRELLTSAITVLLIVFAFMLVYIGIRFDVFSGVAALFGALHDVLITCAFMVFFRAFFAVNTYFFAAALPIIIGYSLNNTIIMFGRVREIVKTPGSATKPRAEIAEKAVRATLGRTINTSVIMLVTLLALFIFGVEAIREFAFPLIIGMIAGVYSSVLLNGQIWAICMDKYTAAKAARKAGKATKA